MERRTRVGIVSAAVAVLVGGPLVSARQEPTRRVRSAAQHRAASVGIEGAAQGTAADASGSQGRRPCT